MKIIKDSNFLLKKFSYSAKRENVELLDNVHQVPTNFSTSLKTIDEMEKN